MSILSQADKELTLDHNITEKGGNPKDIKRTQEWLCLHGFHTAIDGIVGPATSYQIEMFQRKNGLQPDGIVGPRTFKFLTRPMRDALNTSSNIPLDFRQCVVTVAKQHLEAHAREVGGENRGPWVRLYMKGNEGNVWSWCAGFVSFVFEQAAVMKRSFMLGDKTESPIQYTFSCDVLAQQAQHKFKDRLDFIYKWDKSIHTLIRPGDIFLNRRSDIDWVHTGIVISVSKEVFHTIEGNTNDEGSREGFEVCKRVRTYRKKDFITYDILNSRELADVLKSRV